MGRAPCCDKTQVKRGPWSPEEDDALIRYIQTHGSTGNWIALPQKAGLNRCGKSCRLRWLNYLRPDIKHGCFTPEEDNIICTLYSQMGSRWSIIASQLPGRTDNDVKNHWNTKLKKKLMAATGNTITSQVNAVPATTDKLFPVSYKSRSGDPIETSHSFSYFVASESQNYRPLPEFSNHLHSYGLTNSTHKLTNSVPLAQVSSSEVTDQMGNYSQEGSSNVSGNGEIVDQEAEILAEFGFEVPYDENVIGPIFHESSPDEVPYADMISPSSQGITSPSVANLYY